MTSASGRGGFDVGSNSKRSRREAKRKTDRREGELDSPLCAVEQGVVIVLIHNEERVEWTLALDSIVFLLFFPDLETKS